MHDDANAYPARPPVAKVPAEPRRIDSRELFAGAREIVIDHDGRTYRMRITQLGKLILTA